MNGNKVYKEIVSLIDYDALLNKSSSPIEKAFMFIYFYIAFPNAKYTLTCNNDADDAEQLQILDKAEKAYFDSNNNDTYYNKGILLDTKKYLFNEIEYIKNNKSKKITSRWNSMIQKYEYSKFRFWCIGNKRINIAYNENKKIPSFIKIEYNSDKAAYLLSYGDGYITSEKINECEYIYSIKTLIDKIDSIINK